MAESIPRKAALHHDVKQWQHCSLFNLHLFHDDDDHFGLTKDIIDHSVADEYACSTSTPNVDEPLGKKQLNHSCSFVVLQKNYTTQLEHVAEKLLTDAHHPLNDCKGPSFNRKILLGSTAILDNFLRNNLKTPLLANAAHAPSSSETTETSSSTKMNMASGNRRRWHSERRNRHPNVRANLPLTTAQRQVLEHYMNYPPTKIPSARRLHRHELVTGKVIENTGTVLSTLAEQPLTVTTTTINLRKNSTSLNHTHSRPLSSTSSSASAVSHHSSINRRRFLADTIVHQASNEECSEDEDDDQSISSELDQTSDEESTEFHRTSTEINVSDHRLTFSETLSECIICCELKRLHKRTCCNFHACTTCLNLYVEQQIKQGIIRIQCPNQQCHIYMHRDEIHKRCVSAEARQKFTRYLIDNNRSINIKTCPRCSNIHEMDIELCRSARRAPTKVQCVECSLVWCFQCHSPWHDGIQCKDFRRGDQMLKKWAKEVHYGQYNAQQCPSCKVYIQRTKGCDHIVCVRCKTEFCYRCGDRFRDIKFIGDHYSELSVLGCKYRFYPDNSFKRRLIRGSILGGKILAAPLLLCLTAAAGAVCVGIGLPAYCCFRLVRQLKARRRRRLLAKLNEPVLITYKTLNEIVPQLIPRDPVNTAGVKPGFSAIRTTNQSYLMVDIDPTSDAPIAVFDECDINIVTHHKNSC